MAFIVVKGLREFVAYTKRVGTTDIPGQIRKAHLQVATDLADAIRSRAPVGKASDHDPHPGALRASTKPRATQRKATVEIGKGLAYTKPVIFGWPSHGIKRYAYPYFVAANMRGMLVTKYWNAVHAALEGKL